MVSRLEKLGHYNILLRTKVYQRLVPRWIIAPHFSRNASIQVTLLTSVRGSDRCPARRLTAMPKGDTEDLFPGALGGTYIEVQILDPSKPSCQQNYEPRRWGQGNVGTGYIVEERRCDTFVL